MQPYVIKQGDYLASLADKFDFDADTVWKDPANAELRDLRKDPNMLCATDILQIPDQTNKEPKTFSLKTGQTNTFVSQSSMVTVNVRFASCLCLTCDGQSLKGEAYEVAGADVPPGNLTDEGYFTATVPTTTTELAVTLTDRNEVYRIKIGHLDPANTPTGALQRLAMLGFVDSPAIDEAGEDDNGLPIDLRYMLWEFQRSHGIPMTADLDDATAAKLVERIGQ
jgi:hypothetical protein